MKKIAIFQYDLGMGGIQKSLINLLNTIDLNKYKIDLYLFDKTKFFKNTIPKEIKVTYLKPENKKFKRFDSALKQSKLIIEGEYDYAIDFSSYSPDCAIGAIKANAKKRIIWCHNDIDLKLKHEWKYKVLFHFMKSKHKYFDTVVAVSNGAKDGFYKKTKFQDIKVIPNLINTDEIYEKELEEVKFNVDEDYYNIVAVGRLCHQKNYLESLTIMNKLKDEKIRLYIIGAGEEENLINTMIKDNNLKNVFLLGGKQNPYPYMSLMDALLLTSHYEGQGMVLLEAKALGLELYLPKRLERYVDNIVGQDDIVASLKNATKKKKIKDNLKKYNKEIVKHLDELFKS